MGEAAEQRSPRLTQEERGSECKEEALSMDALGLGSRIPVDDQALYEYKAVTKPLSLRYQGGFSV